MESSSFVRVIENISHAVAQDGIVSVGGILTMEKVESKIFNFILSALLLEGILPFLLINLVIQGTSFSTIWPFSGITLWND
jgi:hypothetical protein